MTFKGNLRLAAMNNVRRVDDVLLITKDMQNNTVSTPLALQSLSYNLFSYSTFIAICIR